MAKNIKELTEYEAIQILAFYLPNKTDYDNPKNYDYWFTGLSFEPKKTDEGGQYITFGGRSIIGIEYRGGLNNDGFILHFDNSKVVLWLYKNGYDITELLETNKYFSEMENDFSNMAFEVEQLSKGDEVFRETHKQNWTLDYVTKKCKELIEKYYYKDYE